MKVLFDTEMEKLMSPETADDLPQKSDSIPDIVIDEVDDCNSEDSAPGITVNFLGEEAMRNAKNSELDKDIKQETVAAIPNGVAGNHAKKKCPQELMQSAKSEPNSEANDGSNEETNGITHSDASHAPIALPEIVIAPPEEDQQKPKLSLANHFEELERPRTLSSPLSKRKHSEDFSSSYPDITNTRPRTLSSPTIKRKHVVGPDGEIIPVTPFPSDIEGVPFPRPRAISSPSSKRVHVINDIGPPPSSYPDTSYTKQLVLGSPITKHRHVLGPAKPGSSPPCSPHPDKRVLITECSFPEDLEDPHQLEFEPDEKLPKQTEIDESDRFYLPSQSEADFNNNTTETDTDKPKKLRRWAKAFEPQMKDIEEEEDLLADTRRSRSDTLCGEELTGLALIVRQDMQNYTRFRCLTQVDKIPSHRMFSKFYSSRPYLTVYTRMLANQGIYRSAGITVTMRNNPRRNSSFPDAIKRRSSMFGDTLSRRTSVRRSSLLPDITKFLSGSSKQVNDKDSPPASTCDSVSLNARPSVNAINLDDIKKVQQIYEKNNKKKTGLLDLFFCCVSDKSKGVDTDSDCHPY